MAKENSHEMVQLRGRPASLESVILTPFAVGLPIAANFPSEKLKAPPFVFVRPLGAGGVRVRLKFPRNTPPGSYKGTLLVGDTEFDTIAEVDAEPNLKLIPSRIGLSLNSGDQRMLNLTIVNDGNEPYDIRRAHGLGLFATTGLEDAFGAAYRESKEGGQERLTILVDKLSEFHGGLVRVVVENGAGIIAPDEVRPLRLHLKFPDNLRPGYTYTGTLRIQRARCSLRIDVPRKSREGAP